MANQHTWISYSQIDRFSEETTAIRIRRGLNESGRSIPALQNFVAYVCAVLIIYDAFCPDKCLQSIYYHDEMYQAFAQDNWSLDMLRYLPHLRGSFYPDEWARVWRRYYRKMRRMMLEKGMPSLHQQLQLLDDKTIAVLEAGIGEKVLAEMAADASLRMASG